MKNVMMVIAALMLMVTMTNGQSRMGSSSKEVIEEFSNDDYTVKEILTDAGRNIIVIEYKNNPNWFVIYTLNSESVVEISDIFYSTSKGFNKKIQDLNENYVIEGVGHWADYSGSSIVTIILRSDDNYNIVRYSYN